MTASRIVNADALTALRSLPEGCADMCVTSPPYFRLRNYGGGDKEIGLEETPEGYIAALVEVFAEVRRVLRDDGALWVVIGDSYAGSGKGGNPDMDSRPAAVPRVGGKTTRYNDIKPKDLIGIPWMLAFALRADGWWWRQEIVWAKANVMPESVTDRCTRAHETVLMFAKSARYYYNAAAIKEKAVTGEIKPRGSRGALRPNSGRRAQYNAATRRTETRNKRDVWHVATEPLKMAHFATYPTKLITPIILAGSRRGGIVVDPFFGAGTTGIVADRHGRNFIGIDLNPDYCALARGRIYGQPKQLSLNLGGGNLW